MQKVILKATITKSLIFDSILSLNKAEWSLVNNGSNIYLSWEYLYSLEESMKDEMDFAYSISYNSEGKPILIAAFQLVKFTTNKKKCPKVILNHKPHNVSFNLLVCGNVFSNGDNGFIKTSVINYDEAIEELTSIAKRIKKLTTSKKISITLFKEFPTSSIEKTEGFKRHNYSDFMVDVSMVLQIHDNWKNLDTYLSSMKTKYRTRAKGIYKKSKELVIKSLTTDEINIHKEELTTLLENVSKKAEYSYGRIDVKAFALFKKNLKNDFCLRALFLDGKIVGYSTSFYNNEQLDANYVGIDYEYNADYAIYQRLLCDYVEQAINKTAKSIHFGRTSELVKSSLGAEPVNMKLYAKHKNSLSNFLLKPVFNYITPSNFELRKPFKADFKY
jgi:hypothetical protein